MNNKAGLYLHIPFCRSKCAYCDFYSAFSTPEFISRYISALAGEIKRKGESTRQKFDSVYIGGGTPSLISSSDLSSVMNAVFSSFSIEKDAEITVEMNPESVTEDFVSAAKNSGVNRVSLGAQTFSEPILKILSRRHTPKDTENAVSLLRRKGFENISLDLISALPDCDEDTFLSDIKKAVMLGADHISAYMLILEEGTKLFAEREKHRFPDESECERQYLTVCDYLESSGYSHYEISNFAKPEKESRHNLKYWLLAPYLGIGPSAYSYFEGRRFHYENDIRKFIRSPETVFDEAGGGFEEYIMLSLRLKRGLLFSELSEYFGMAPNVRFSETVRFLEKEKLVLSDENGIRLTDKGMLVSNSVIGEFLKEELYENL